jgi:hypothetical protein
LAASAVEAQQLGVQLHALKEFMEVGGLMEYQPSIPALDQHAVSSVDQCLTGAKPGGLSVKQPTTFASVCHLKTAQALDLTMPPRLLF